MKRRKPKKRVYAVDTLITQVARRLANGEALLCFRHGVRTFSTTTTIGKDRAAAALFISKAVEYFGLTSARGIESIEPPATPMAFRSVTRCSCGAFMQLGGVCADCEP